LKREEKACVDPPIRTDCPLSLSLKRPLTCHDISHIVSGHASFETTPED
jgi:hypothetical protein